MPRTDVEFKTSDHVTLRGWLYTSSGASSKLPCLIMSHGWSALKEMDLDAFAEHFTSKLDMACLVYDNRGFGSSDTGPGQPRHEIIPSVQCSDIQDAITYASSRDEIDSNRLGIWGSSYSGGHVLSVGSIEKRLKAVISQVPLVDGRENFRRLVRSDFAVGSHQLFAQSRLDRAAGKDAMMIPVVDEDPTKPSSLPTADSYTFFSMWEKKSPWKNEVTVRSVEGLWSYIPSHRIEDISPAALLMVVAEHDVLTPTDLALKAFSRAIEPKQLQILPGAGHFDGYTGKWFEQNLRVQTAFLAKHLVGEGKGGSSGATVSNGVTVTSEMVIGPRAPGP